MARKKVAKKAKKATKAKVVKKAAKKVAKGMHGRALGKTQISISLSEDLVNSIDKMAAKQNRNRSNFISNVLLDKVEGK